MMQDAGSQSAQGHIRVVLSQQACVWIGVVYSLGLTPTSGQTKAIYSLIPVQGPPETYMPPALKCQAGSAPLSAVSASTSRSIAVL